MEETDRIVERWMELKKMQAEVEKKCEQYREKVEEHMKQNRVDQLFHKGLTITRVQSKRETISRKDLPEELWDRYHKTSLFTVLRVTKK